MNNIEFIEKAKILHPNYDYSKTLYQGYNKKVEIQCPKHGLCSITAKYLLIGNGCKQCGIESRAEKCALTQEEFISHIQQVHGDKYDLTKTIYNRLNKYLTVICRRHGEFQIRASNFLRGQGCNKCYRGIYGQQEFLDLVKQAYNDKYILKSIYIDNHSYIDVECKSHGIFRVLPKDFLSGKECPECKKEWNTEKVQQYIKENTSYEYSSITFIDKKTPIKLVCNKHGEFEIPFSNILNGSGCKKCSYEERGKKRSLTKEAFLQIVKQKYPEYEYSKTEYKSLNEKVIVTCGKHGDFEIYPTKLLYRHGCTKCGQERRVSHYKITPEIFLKRIECKFPRYHFNNIQFNSISDKIEVTCEKHGLFKTSPYLMLQGQGCKKCGYERIGDKSRLSEQEFLNRVKQLHPEYDYSKVVYNNCEDKITVICKKHGEFKIRPANILRGSGCRECGLDKISKARRLTTEEFIEKAKQIRPEYDYSEVEYKGTSIKVKVSCEKHGAFFSRPNSILSGYGCPICNMPIGELKIRNWLLAHNIEYERQKRFKPLGNLSYDFYVSEKNLLIEFNGQQHYMLVPRFHPNGLIDLRIQFENDLKKQKYAFDNNIQLLSIPYWEISNIDKLLEDVIILGKQIDSIYTKYQISDNKQDIFIGKAKKVFPNYVYDKVEYINSQEKVIILCEKHGEFKQIPSELLRGHGCQFCGYEEMNKKRRMSNIEFIERAKQISPKYDYSKTNYLNSRFKVTVTCLMHGDFEIAPYSLLRGHGCRKCSRLNTEL